MKHIIFIIVLIVALTWSVNAFSMNTQFGSLVEVKGIVGFSILIVAMLAGILQPSGEQ